LAIASTRGDTANATIARAGRASVRVSLARWSEALQDAQQIPLSFSHSIRFSGSASSSQFNAIYWASANQPYRNHTVWSTWLEGHFSDTEGPRTEWGSDPAVPNGENAAIPWYFQRKCTGVAAPLKLVTGREARLIVAEGLLRSDDLPGAVQAINSVREPIGLDPIAPGSLEDAWLALKLERTAEFWLEARRLGDYRRWA